MWGRGVSGASEAASQDLPEGFFEELGRVAYWGAQVEETSYMVADALSLRVRGERVSGVLQKCADRVRTYGLPPWSSDEVTANEILEWLERAKAALAERNVVIHSRRYLVGRGTSAAEVREAQTKHALGSTRDSPTSVQRLLGVRERLFNANRTGMRIMIGLLATANSGARFPILPSEGYRDDWREVAASIERVRAAQLSARRE